MIKIQKVMYECDMCKKMFAPGDGAKLKISYYGLYRYKGQGLFHNTLERVSTPKRGRYDLCPDCMGNFLENMKHG